MNKAQSATEYALLLVVVLAGVVAMQTYAKRGIQAVIKGGIDEFGPQETAEFLPVDVISAEEATAISSKSTSTIATRAIQGGSGERQLQVDSTTIETGTAVSTQLSVGGGQTQIVVDLGRRKKEKEEFYQP